VDTDAGNDETSSACSSDSEDGQSTRGSDASHAAYSGANKRKQETTDGWSCNNTSSVSDFIQLCSLSNWFSFFVFFKVVYFISLRRAVD